jgi:hypothetical protein
MARVVCDGKMCQRVLAVVLCVSPINQLQPAPPGRERSRWVGVVPACSTT